MPRFKYSLLAAAGILVLAFVLSVVGPKRVMAALGYTPIRDVDQPARQPFVADVFPEIADGSAAGSATFSVPAGKRLVVETVSVFREGTLHAGQSVQVFVAAKTNGNQGYYALPYVPATTAQYPGISQPLRFYVDPGTGVGVEVYRTGTVGAEGDYVTVSGYLVDLP